MIKWEPHHIFKIQVKVKTGQGQNRSWSGHGQVVIFLVKIWFRHHSIKSWLKLSKPEINNIKFIRLGQTEKLQREKKINISINK